MCLVIDRLNFRSRKLFIGIFDFNFKPCNYDDNIIHNDTLKYYEMNSIEFEPTKCSKKICHYSNNLWSAKWIISKVF